MPNPTYIFCCSGAIAALFAISMASVSAADRQPAQTAAPVPDALSCSTCKVLIGRRSIDLKAADLTKRPSGVRMDGKGRLWVFSGQQPATLFDSTGKFLRVVGPTGSGPGEYRPGGAMLTLSADSLLVVDLPNGRATVMTSDLRAVEVVPASIAWSRGIGLQGRRLVVSGFMGEPDHVGLPLHFVDVTHDGLKVARSFGDAAGDFTPGRSSQIALSWELASAAGGGFWSMDILQYRMRKWSADGRQLMDLERSASWFPPQESMSIGNREQPPRPYARGLSEAGGLLWSVINVPGRDWKSAWPKDAPLSGELRAGAINTLKLFETLIEAIDPRTRRVVGRLQLAETTVGVLPGAKIVTYTEDPNGFPILTVLTLSIKR